MRRLYRYHFAFVALAILASVLILPAARLAYAVATPSAPDQTSAVTAAWEKARAAGGYHFTSDVTQVTLPVATLTNVGRTSRTEKLFLEGQNDLRGEKLALTLWSEGGSVLQAESGLRMRTEAGKTFVQRGANDWEEIDDFTGALAPQGDFMAYLAAIKDVQAQPNEVRNGISFTRYTFAIDSPRFAAYMHGQMEATLRARGELPPGIQLEVSSYFRDMVGHGELWIGADGLPLRQILELQFPAQKEEQVHTQLVVDFSDFSTPTPVATTDGDYVTSVITRAVTDAAVWTVQTGLLYALTLAGMAILLLVYRHKRLLNVAVVSLVIFSQVAGPLLTTITHVRFLDTQTAKAATDEARQTAASAERDLRAALGAAPEFNPHLNPLSAAINTEPMALMPQPAEATISDYQVASAAPAAQAFDYTTDTDGDGLTNFVETRLGTSEAIQDTDGDGLNDNIEVNGFAFGGQTWYTNPDNVDSNGDGASDAVEWGFNADSSRRSVPLDSDGDGFPNLFDADNDNDGVPDSKDLAPDVQGASAYSEAAPLQLTINDLTADKPTVVEFQLRPQDAKQLWYAFNVLDWPQDSAGQVRDVDGFTYANYANIQGRAADSNETNGDLKVVPMLEIRVPNSGANLPSQADLTPFNISVNNFTTDGQTKVAYVPLSLVTDEKTGQRVAFSGQMRYQPTGSWPSAHQVRLAWVVQALVDVPCDKTTDTSADCQADGYRNNVPQMIQSYYGNWTLAGLNVREEHGTDMAIIYEDPAPGADPNKTDDAALWALSYALDGQFVVARDDNNDAVRDLKLSDFGARFDRDNNPSAAQRMDVPNHLQVVTNSYPTVEQATAFTAMTETVKILNQQFAAPVASDRAIKPLLLFAQENRSRQLGLSFADVSNSFVAQSGASLTFNMAPGDQPARPVGVTAGLKWMAYCAPATGQVSFSTCADDDYWATLEGRYANLAPLPTDSNPNWVGGRLQLAQFYYTGLRNGFYTTVQEGNAVLSAPLSLQTETETAADIRNFAFGLSTGPTIAVLAIYRLVPASGGVRVPFSTVAGIYLESGALFRKAIQEANAEVSKSLAETGWGAGRGLNNALDKVIELKSALRKFNHIRLGMAGGIFSALLQVLSAVPALPIEARAVLGALSTAFSLVFSVVLPIMNFVRLAQTAGTSLLRAISVLHRAAEGIGKGAVIGAVIGVAVTWGFFIYTAATSGLAAGNPELNRAAFEAIAGSVVIVLLTILAANPVGAIIAAIIGVIDLLLTIICEAGVNELRQVPGLGGACFTLTTTVTKYLLYLIYNYDLMVDIGRGDLMVTGSPNVTLADPSKGYVAGNAINVSMAVTTTLLHKNPDPANGVLINGYLYLFSPENLRRNTFNYSLSAGGPQTPASALGQMVNEWQDVRERSAAEGGKYVLSPMYRGQAVTSAARPVYNPVAGLNQGVGFHINQGYAATAYECWMMWIPGTPIFFPVCYEREYKGENHVPVNNLIYDIFPTTIDGLMAQTGLGNGSYRLDWDFRFPALADGDGDGLRNAAFNGLDLDDSKIDSDNDGLTDRFELEQRSAGYAVSPILRDTDSDGLTDRQEIELNTNPAVADTDNDGLADGVEVRHLVYDANGNPTTTWAGGWQVTINHSTPFSVWVSSDPLTADSDNDSISDQAEKSLAADANPANRVDSQGVPYHPGVFNRPPLAVYTASNSIFGFVAPNQSLRYTTTVVANAAVAPGILNVTVPSVAGVAPNPLALAFNPSASVPQTVTQPLNFTISSGATTGNIDFTSTATTRLANSGGAGWTFGPVTAETGLGNFTNATLARGVTVAANRADRQDAFRLAAKISNAADTLGTGDIYSADLLAATNSLLDGDDNRIMQRGATDPDMACNTAGDCLVAWDEAELFGNGVVQGVTYRTGSSIDNGFVGDMANAGDRLLPIDFNGDGNEDILYYRSGPAASGAATAGVYLSNGDGTLAYHGLNNNGTPANGFLPDVPADGRDLLVPVNINGDAYDDILFFRPGGGAVGVFITNSDRTVTYLPYRDAGVSVNGFLGDMASPVDSLQPMDVNGDGRDDLLYYRPGGSAAGVYVASSSGNGHLTFIPYRDSLGIHNGFAADMANGLDRLVPMDSNGDGKDDIYYARPGGQYAGIHLASASGDGTLTYVPYRSPSGFHNGWYPDMSSNYDISIPLDINGDGKDDIFFARVGSGFAGVHITNPQGDGSVTYVEYRNGGTGLYANGWYPDMSSFEDRIVPMDQNGDGKDDLLFYRRGGQFAGIHLANPQGDGSVTYLNYRTPSGNDNGFGGDVASTADDAMPIDLNGDGRRDFLWLRPGGSSAAAYLTVLNTPVHRIGGALVGPNGAIKQRLTFPRRNPAAVQYPAINRHPQVASNGSGFLVSYETVAPALDNTHSIVLEGFDQNGNPVGNYLHNVGDVPRGDDRSLDNDLAWMGDRYRLALKGRSLNTIFIGDFNPNATMFPAGFVALASDGLIATAASKIDTTPSLAWDPTSGRWTMAYIRGANDAPDNVQLNRYPSLTSTAADASNTFLSAYERANLVWHPQSRGWLFNGQLTDNRQVFGALAANLQGLTGDLATSTQIGWTAADVPSSALACPVVSSLPVLDLRFEELPGATTFVDSSGFNNNAICGSPSQCPTLGVPGAPNAPLSDYGFGFNSDQYLRVANSATFEYDTTESFTWMAWIKTNTSSPILRKGIGGVNDLMLSIHATGQLRMSFGDFSVNNTLTGGPDLRNNQWHHVAVTLNRATNVATLYVDGVSLGGGNFTGSFVTADDLFIGSGNTGGYIGQLDHLQFFNTALDATTISAIYNRTEQSYCVVASASNGSPNNNIQWARLRVTQQDTRGGSLSASGSHKVTVDSNPPTASITSVSNNDIVGPGLVIAGTASDATSGVAFVEVSINNGAWQLANGANSWTFSLAGQNGAISLRARATDLVGNVGAPSTAINLTVDSVAPIVTITPVTGTIKPTKNANGRWQVRLFGTATDAVAGVQAGLVRMLLTSQAADGVVMSPQVAEMNGNNWGLDYLLDASYSDPTGVYTVTVEVEDNLGNRANPLTTVVRLDATGPIAALNVGDATRAVITQTLTISGVVSDTNSIVGLDKLEIAFTPVEQVAALPPGLTSEQAEAQLNRVWLPVTLAQRGAGVATTTWSVAIPAGLENIYQIDLRGTDMLGNVSISAGVWRGMIDTLDPRVVMTATATGATYTDTADNTQRYAMQFVCAAQDRNLDESRFACPGLGLAEPVRSFENNAALQALFPDLTLRTGLALSYTLWTPTTTPAARASACDSFDRCATATTSTGAAAGDGGTVDSEIVTAAAAPGAPVAVIVNPTDGSFVAANQAVSVTVAAEAGATLREVTIRLDNGAVQTLSFSQAEAVTRTVRTLNLPITGEGPHTLVAQATAWDNSSQTTLFPVTFTLDQNAPTVTIDASALTLADTWQAESGILRFNGTASDSVGLAAVQIREGANAFVDTTFGNGTWRVALPVQDPEGRTLTISVRAIDRAGRTSEVTQTITTELSAADAPDTTISSGPANPSSDNTATFVFAGSASAVAFDCQLDDGVYTPCASPIGYSDLSKGNHTFRVRAIDGRGLADLSPAEQSWTVNASALDVTLSSSPANPTTSRSAPFAFTGNGSSFECRLDDATFTACTSPQQYSGLTNGEHVFQVRARSGDTVGAAARFAWTVTNAAPVASDQAVTTNQDTALAITLVAGDEDAVTYKVGSPAHGVLVGIPPALTYSPNTGYTGVDSFTFTASDGLVTSNLGTVTIDVQGTSTANRAPVAVDDGLPTTGEIVAQGRITLTTLLDNDSDPDDTTAADGNCTGCSITAVGQASQGTVTLVGPNVTYVATNPTFRGTDTFTYTVSDNDARGALSDTAQVAVTVQADATPGDCNANGTIDAGDLTALGLEIFDGDGNRWYDADLGSVAFSGYGCDANADAVIDAGDLTCTARRIFDNVFVCGSVVAAQASPATLAVGTSVRTEGTDMIDIPIVLGTAGHHVAAAAFSLHWDAAQLGFDPSDANGDGRPDAVQFHLPEGLLASATYHAEASRLDIVVLGIAQPLPQLADGPLATVRLTMPVDGTASPTLHLSTASLGGEAGQSIPLTVSDGAAPTPTQPFQLFVPLAGR